MLAARHRDLTRLSDTVLEQAIELKHYSENLEARVRGGPKSCAWRTWTRFTCSPWPAKPRTSTPASTSAASSRYTALVAERLGLPTEHIEEFAYSAVLHDIGKMAIPDQILKKPGRLTDVERRRIESHTIEGERMLADKPFFTQARFIARSHHENWDGSGYPDGLRGLEIPLAARIVHLVDVFDALTSPRVYKKAWTPTQARDAILEKSKLDFDPAIVDAFKSLFDEDAFSGAISAATATPR